MKTKLLITGWMLLFLFPLLLTAQHDADHDADWKSRKEKIDAFKIAFFTERINFTPQEAQSFWPVYNDYRAKQESMMHNFRNKFGKSLSDPDALSDQQANEVLDATLKDMESMGQLTNGFYQKVRAILPPQKIIKLFEAEKDFKRALLKKMNEFPDDKK
jgi:hypothetical protein